MSATNLVVNDTFTGSDGTNLTAHTPDTGTGWQDIDSRVYQINASNQCECVDGGIGIYETTALTGDQKAEATNRASTSWGPMCNVAVQSDFDLDCYLFARITDTFLILRRLDDNSATNLAFDSGASSADVKIGVENDGGTIRGYRDDVEQVNAADSTYTGGNVGLWASGAGDPICDDFNGYDESGGGGGGDVIKPGAGLIGGRLGDYWGRLIAGAMRCILAISRSARPFAAAS